ncbi:MAG: pyruvate, phosphate dikinase [Thermoanaerobaculia bacterium]
MSRRWIRPFGAERTEAGPAAAGADEKWVLGGKGAGLAEMSRLGLPVPPGFTITTEACLHYLGNGGELPAGLEAELAAELASLEEVTGHSFASPDAPLLVSVRSGAAISMPGMMDTVLNIGLNDDIVAARIAAGWEPRFGWDCYRRLLSMYGDVVLGVPHAAFEKELAALRQRDGATTDAELSGDSLAELCARYQELIRQHAQTFPQDPREQLWGALRAVFDSWSNRRAHEYRRLHGIPDDMGTAVNVQTMVFGNRGPDCATGVAFTRSPADGTKRLYGEFLVNAQGEDVVAGIRTPQPILAAERLREAPTEQHAEPQAERTANGQPGLADVFPQAFDRLEETCRILERARLDMQDVEFTIDGGRLYMLQTRAGQRTGPAAVRIAVDMVDEGLIEPRLALKRVAPAQLVQLLAPVFDPVELERTRAAGGVLARGLAAGPGAASGRIALTAERATEMAAQGPVLLVREETSPEDIVGMHAAAGILTSRGGMTSHAAVVARGMGKPCVVGAGALEVDEEHGRVRVSGETFEEGDELSIDGTSGEVLAGRLTPRASEVLTALEAGDGGSGSPLAQAFLRLLDWADEARRLKVRANADTPEDARVARLLGAEGVGLCRTEHMFFDEARIHQVRQLILAAGEGERTAALAALLPVQQQDFEAIFTALDGLPVTVRLLDPPLHEFLPREPEAVEAVAELMGVEPEAVRAKVASLAEANPMLGHRGCRLGLTFPAIYRMQVEAIARATAACRERGIDARPEIMVPLVGTEEEMKRLRTMIEEAIGEMADTVPIGTMIEVPRAALVADRIAASADFFSFGTNDLTQLTYGYSRDDAGRFLPQYLEERILPTDPFAELDPHGVGELVRLACERGRAARGDLKLGICGEHGGDPASVAFFHEVGLDYVSCSPYRVPVARLAAARAALDEPAGEEWGTA